MDKSLKFLFYCIAFFILLKIAIILLGVFVLSVGTLLGWF